MFIEAQVFILTGLCGSVRQQLRSVSLGDFELVVAPLKLKVWTTLAGYSCFVPFVKLD